MVPRQLLIVRLNGHDQDSPPEDYLPTIRPYGVTRMAWALWREVPDVTLRASLALATKVRGQGRAEVLVTSEWLAEHVEGRLLAVHRLATRLERLR